MKREELRARMVEAAKDAFADEVRNGTRLLTDERLRKPWTAIDEALAAAWTVVEKELAEIRDQLWLAHIDAVNSAAELGDASNAEERG